MQKILILLAKDICTFLLLKIYMHTAFIIESCQLWQLIVLVKNLLLHSVIKT